MRSIELRLDPAVVTTLLAAIDPTLRHLRSELASPAVFPEEEDQVMEDFWRNDLLESQRSEVDAISALFDADFMESGRALIEPDAMDRVLRACSAIRLRLREAALSEFSDDQLERGDFEGVQWTEQLQASYAAYALFASLQELIVTQMMDPDHGDLEFEDDGN